MDAATLLLMTAVFYLVVKKRLNTYIGFATTPKPGAGFNPASYTGANTGVQAHVSGNQ